VKVRHALGHHDEASFPTQAPDEQTKFKDNIVTRRPHLGTADLCDVIRSKDE
jgi:hypothetical protein